MLIVESPGFYAQPYLTSQFYISRVLFDMDCFTKGVSLSQMMKYMNARLNKVYLKVNDTYYFLSDGVKNEYVGFKIDGEDLRKIAPGGTHRIGVVTEDKQEIEIPYVFNGSFISDDYRYRHERGGRWTTGRDNSITLHYDGVSLQHKCHNNFLRRVNLY